jgi:hypothetical protein
MQSQSRLAADEYLGRKLMENTFDHTSALIPIADLKV